jgi:formamidopyrimidine-DNA glycosylase
MPELPEVETMAAKVRPRLVGRTITAFEARWAPQCEPSVEAVTHGLTGRRVTEVGRRGKHVVFSLDDGTFARVHFRMSGRFAFGDEPEGSGPHVRAVWRLDLGPALTLVDARKWGRIRHAATRAEVDQGLGVEPLGDGFTPAVLGALTGRTSRGLKALLQDQAVLAGLGNIYTDEALFRARLHPRRPAGTLETAEIERLHAAIREVLQEGIAANGTSFDWVWPGGHMQDNLRVYGREGQPCVVCRATIAWTQVGQRGTRFCPTCQPLP